MYRYIGKEVYTIGRQGWNKRKWGVIVAVGNNRYFIVKYECGRKAWIRKDWILFKR